jgi:hypothetical protein
MEWGTLKISLGDPPSPPANEQPVEEQNALSGFPEGILTPEQLMYYSSGGTPDKDPFRNE